MTPPDPDAAPPRAELPAWLVARGGLRLSLESADHAFGHCLHAPLTQGTAEVLVYTDPDETLITWLTRGNLDDWHCSLPDAYEVARANLDRLLDEAELQVESLHGQPLALLAVDSVFKASLLLAPGLRKKVEPALGWPLRAVVPCRDFVFLFRDDDDDLIELLSGPVVTEYTGSEHRVCLEVLRIDDDGLHALGAYDSGT